MHILQLQQSTISITTVVFVFIYLHFHPKRLYHMSMIIHTIHHTSTQTPVNSSTPTTFSILSLLPLFLPLSLSLALALSLSLSLSLFFVAQLIIKLHIATLPAEYTAVKMFVTVPRIEDLPCLSINTFLLHSHRVRMPVGEGERERSRETQREREEASRGG